MLKTGGMILALAAALLLAPGPAAAHKTNVFAFVENGQLKGEGYFPGGGKAQGCVVEVYDATGNKLATTKTDRPGQFIVPLPAGKPPIRVVLKAGEGHRAEYRLNAAELGPAPAGAAETDRTTVPVPAPPAMDRGASLGRAELEEVLGPMLEQKLAPLKAQLARLAADQGVTLRDVVAGLGYILGLLGLAAYLRYRRQGGGK